MVCSVLLRMYRSNPHRVLIVSIVLYCDCDMDGMRVLMYMDHVRAGENEVSNEFRLSDV